MNLLDCLTLPIKSNQWGDSIKNPVGELYFQDNGANVLAVAHLDSVMVSKPYKKGSFVIAPQLDDRLGAWVILNLLPQLNIKVDVLLTDCEEVAKSTAEHFEPDKQYNWMVEFDRHGSDIVMYQYEHTDYVNLLEKFGFKCGFGSFSDICTLDHLDIMGFNVGIGYYREHTKHCYADLAITKKQVLKFAEFWQEYKDTPLPQLEEQYFNNPWNDYTYKRLDDPRCDEYEDQYINEIFQDTRSNNYKNNCQNNDYWGDEYHKLEQLAEYYGYNNIDEFIKDGGLDLFDQHAGSYHRV